MSSLTTGHAYIDPTIVAHLLHTRCPEDHRLLIDIYAYIDEIFSHMDRNNDGQVNQNEIAVMLGYIDSSKSRPERLCKAQKYIKSEQKDDNKYRVSLDEFRGASTKRIQVWLETHDLKKICDFYSEHANTAKELSVAGTHTASPAAPHVCTHAV